MGQCFLYGNGGGSQLYYDVKCQTAEPAKKEGRIWVKSSVAMTRFLFHDNPWSSATVGTVMVSGGLGGADPSSTTSTILVFKTKVTGIENFMKMKPSSCKQVQGSTGNWVNVDAYVCHSDTWVQFSSTWSGELFENGNLYEDYTGGWPAKLGALSETSPYLKYSAGSQNIVVSSGKMIDLTNYSQLHVIGRGRGDYTSSGSVLARVPDFGVAKTIGSTSVTYAAKVSMTSGYIGDLSTLTEEKVLDISSLSGEYYVAMTITGSHTGATLGVKKIWLT